MNSAQKPDWIITYPPFGLNIAFCMADLLQCKFGYIQSLDQPEINFNVQSGETVLFCADDLYSGSSFRKVHHALIDVKAKIIEPLLVVANFSGMAVFDQYKVVALLDRNVSQWDEGSCPLCASGSAAISARENWQDLITAAGPQSRKAIQPEVK